MKQRFYPSAILVGSYPQSNGSCQRIVRAGLCRTTCHTSSASKLRFPEARRHLTNRQSLITSKNAIGEHNENEIDVRRSQSGAQVLEEWNSVSSNRITQLRAADDAYFETPMMLPTGPGTLGDFLSIRILDCWVHEQDMRRATGIAGNEGGPAAEHTIDRLIRTLPIVVGKRAATPEGASVVIAITGSVQRNIPITVINGRATIVTAPPADVLCTVQLDSNAFTALATGRQTADQLANRLHISGDNDLGQRVVTQLNMMI